MYCMRHAICHCLLISSHSFSLAVRWQYLPRLMLSYVTSSSSIGNSILCNMFYTCKVIVSIRCKSILSNWFYPCQNILSSPTWFILQIWFHLLYLILSFPSYCIFPRWFYLADVILSSLTCFILQRSFYPFHVTLSSNFQVIPNMAFHLLLHSAHSSFKLFSLCLSILPISLYPLIRLYPHELFLAISSSTIISILPFLVYPLYYLSHLDPGIYPTSQKHASDASPNLVQ